MTGWLWAGVWAVAAGVFLSGTVAGWELRRWWAGRDARRSDLAAELRRVLRKNGAR